MWNSGQLSQRLVDGARTVAFHLFRLPVIGYALRIGVGIAKLPRLNHHLRRIDLRVARLAEQPAPRDSGFDTPGLDTPGLDTYAARIAALEGAWRQNIPPFLNAVGTVPALARNLNGLQQALDTTDAQVKELHRSLALVAERLDGIDARQDAIEADLGRIALSLEALAASMDYDGGRDAGERGRAPLLEQDIKSGLR